MHADALHQAAASLDAAPDLLPVLPELLEGIDALGTEPGQVVELLRARRLGRGHRVLDLGCGKGAVAIALARSLGVDVLGIDAMAAFVAEAERQARAQRVTERCAFRCADLRAELGADDCVPFDGALLLAVGRPWGTLAATVAAVRRWVRPGGFLVIDDAALGDGERPPPGCDGYLDLAGTRLELESCGDRVVREVVAPPAQVAGLEAAIQARIAANAAHLVRRRPEWADAVHAFVAAQSRAAEALTAQLVPVLWLLERE